MKIGIIGAGQIGGTLTRRLTKLGHTVFVANSRGSETLAELAKETGAKAVPVKDAVRGVDLVVVTIPEKNIPKLPAGLFADVDPKVVVVDTGNYYPRQRDGRIDGIEQGLPESHWVAQQLGRPVIKAFNNIYARHLLDLGKPDAARRRARVRCCRCRRPRRVLAAATVHPGLCHGPRCRGSEKCARRGEVGTHARVAFHAEESRQLHRTCLTGSEATHRLPAMVCRGQNVATGSSCQLLP